MFEIINLIWTNYNLKYVLNNNYYLFIQIYKDKSLKFYLYNGETYELDIRVIGLKQSIIKSITAVEISWDNIINMTIQLCTLDDMIINQYWSEVFNVDRNLNVSLETGWMSSSQIVSIPLFILDKSSLKIHQNIRLDGYWELI